MVRPTFKYAQPPNLFRNRGKGKFEDVATNLGPALQKPIVGRGAAYADFDNDGDLDVVIMANNGYARLLRNDNGNQNDMLRVKTIGTRSNRDGIGAKVTVKTNKGTTLFAMVKSGSSYMSQSELPLTFGLGKPAEGKTVSLTIAWPSGHKDSIANVKPNQFLSVQEGKASDSGEADKILQGLTSRGGGVQFRLNLHRKWFNRRPPGYWVGTCGSGVTRSRTRVCAAGSKPAHAIPRMAAQALFRRETSSGRFIPEMDGLRFVAISMVVLFI